MYVYISNLDIIKGFRASKNKNSAMAVFKGIS